MLRANRWMLLAAGCFAIAFFTLAGLLQPVGDVARRVALPAVRLVAGAAASFGFANQPARGEVTLERVKDLEARIAALAVDSVQLQKLKEENETLRAQARFLSSSGYDSVGARVISREVHDQRALLLIDRGLKDGVEVGQAVITNEGIFIGKVSVLKDRVATVELLTDPLSRVAAAISGQSGVVGVVEGRASGAAVLTYIPSSVTLTRDQLIVTAGSEEKVPGNLPLGVVNAIEGKPTDPFLSAALEPLVPLSRVVTVSVLRPSALRP